MMNQIEKINWLETGKGPKYPPGDHHHTKQQHHYNYTPVLFLSLICDWGWDLGDNWINLEQVYGLDPGRDLGWQGIWNPIWREFK